MNRAHSESGYVFKNPPNNSSNTLRTLNEALAEIALRKGSIKIEWADELRNMYGDKWKVNLHITRGDMRCQCS